MNNIDTFLIPELKDIVTSYMDATFCFYDQLVRHARKEHRDIKYDEYFIDTNEEEAKEIVKELNAIYEKHDNNICDCMECGFARRRDPTFKKPVRQWEYMKLPKKMSKEQLYKIIIKQEEKRAVERIMTKYTIGSKDQEKRKINRPWQHTRSTSLDFIPLTL